MQFTSNSTLLFLFTVFLVVLMPAITADGLRGTDSQDTNRKALAEAIMYAIKSEDGEIEPSLMEAALKTGLQRQEIRHVARLARKEVQADPSKLEKIQNDLEQLAASKYISDTVPAREEKKPETTTRYVPKAAWALPHSAHVASSKAVLSALHSSTYEVDPDLMEKAIQAGWTREHILRAVEAAKPKEERIEVETTNAEPEINATIPQTPGIITATT